MDLYLIRHADALPVGENGAEEDDDRVLSADGEEQAKRVGRFLKSQKVEFDRVFASPLVRARQTAEILLRAAESSLAPTLVSELTPNARPKKLARLLMKSSGERIAIVGHLPHLADFTAWIIGSKKAQIDLAKSGVAVVSAGDTPIKGNGVLHCLLTPDVIQSLAPSINGQ